MKSPFTLCFVSTQQLWRFVIISTRTLWKYLRSWIQKLNWFVFVETMTWETSLQMRRSRFTGDSLVRTFFRFGAEELNSWFSIHSISNHLIVFHMRWLDRRPLWKQLLIPLQNISVNNLSILSIKLFPRFTTCKISNYEVYSVSICALSTAWYNGICVYTL